VEYNHATRKIKPFFKKKDKRILALFLLGAMSRFAPGSGMKKIGY